MLTIIGVSSCTLTVTECAMSVPSMLAVNVRSPPNVTGTHTVNGLVVTVPVTAAASASIVYAEPSCIASTSTVTS